MILFVNKNTLKSDLIAVQNAPKKTICREQNNEMAYSFSASVERSDFSFYKSG